MSLSTYYYISKEKKRKRLSVCQKKRIPLTFVSAKEYENRWINFWLLLLLHWLSILFVEQFFLYYLYFLRTLNCRYVTLSESFQFPLFDGALFERLNSSSASNLATKFRQNWWPWYALSYHSPQKIIRKKEEKIILIDIGPK